MFPPNVDNQPLKLEEKYLCLDFSNTVNWRNGDEPEETLNHYADLVGWSESVGVISHEKAADLLKQARRDPREAEEVLQQALELRELIYRVFSAKAQHEESISAVDIDSLNRYLSTAMARTRLVASPQGFHWAWSDDSHTLDCLIWPIARSAGDLLTSPDITRVGECASDQGCGWLFYDATRNHSRRWCSMESCGNRAKAHRHYERQKPAR